jgi:Domain of unknown function (DUF4180)
MTDTVVEIGGVRVLRIAAEGPSLGSEAGALDIIGATYGQDVEMIAVPVARLGDDFFRLRNGSAGAFIQKFSNYRHRLAIVGDISAHLANSKPLHDFVYESNKGRDVLFVPDMDALAAKL